MNIHALLQVIGTLFVFWRVYSCFCFAQAREKHPRDVRGDLIILSLWCVTAGLTIGYWIDVLS